MHARSGDKGGDANLGLWVSALEERADGARGPGCSPPSPRTSCGPSCRRPPTSTSRSTRCPNLRAVNVVIHGLLGEGVAASSRFDPQAKGLGEWARSRLVDVPEELL